MEFAVVRTWVIFSSGIPSIKISISSKLSIATPTRPTSPSESGSSESKPSCVGRSSATLKPVKPCSSSILKRSFVSAGVPNPPY